MTDESYGGYEQSPIRPPSEAGSLLLRVTRNCPWNRCQFCPVYKGAEFSVRPTDHVIRDIDAVFRALQTLSGAFGARGEPTGDPGARQAAAHWRRHGRGSVFLQDADSLVIPPAADGGDSGVTWRKNSRDTASDLLRPLQHRGPSGLARSSGHPGSGPEPSAPRPGIGRQCRSCAGCTRAPPKSSRSSPVRR